MEIFTMKDWKEGKRWKKEPSLKKLYMKSCGTVYHLPGTGIAK